MQRFNFYKIRLLYLIRIKSLFRGVILYLYDTLLRQHGLVLTFTGMRGFLLGCVPSRGLVCLFYWGEFHNPVSIYLLIPLGVFHHWMAWRPSLLYSNSSGALTWRVLFDTCSLVMCSLPGELRGILNCSVPSALIWTGFFTSPSLFRLPLRRACLAHLWIALFFEVACLMAFL